MGQPLGKGLIQWNMYLRYDPEILPLDIYPKEIKTYVHRRMCANVRSAIIYISSKLEATCTSITRDWVDKLYWISTTACSSATKRNEIVIHTRTQMNFKSSMLVEVVYTQKTKYRIIPFTWNSGVGNTLPEEAGQWLPVTGRREGSWEQRARRKLSRAGALFWCVVQVTKCTQTHQTLNVWNPLYVLITQFKKPKKRPTKWTNKNQRRKRSSVGHFWPTACSFQPLVSVERFRFRCPLRKYKRWREVIHHPPQGWAQEKWWRLVFIPFLHFSSFIRCKMLPCCPLAAQHLLPCHPTLVSFWGSSRTTLPFSLPPDLLDTELLLSAVLREAEANFLCLTHHQGHAMDDTMSPGRYWHLTKMMHETLRWGQLFPLSQLGNTVGKGGYFWNPPHLSPPQSGLPALFILMLCR